MMEVKIMMTSGSSVNDLDSKKVGFLAASNCLCFDLGGNYMDVFTLSLILG